MTLEKMVEILLDLLTVTSWPQDDLISRFLRTLKGSFEPLWWVSNLNGVFWSSFRVQLKPSHHHIISHAQPLSVIAS